MHWIIACLLMFVSSAGLYLTIRKAQYLQIPVSINSLAMFLVPIPMYLGLGLLTHAELRVSWWELGLLAVTALFFSWLGNYFSLTSIKLAPNPGYPLIISKSYVVFTAVASIFLFNSPLPIKSMVAIALIVAFSALIILADKKTDQTTHDLKWFAYSLGAFFCWAFLALMSKHLLDLGVSVIARLLYVHIFVLLTLIGEIWFKKVKIEFTAPRIGYFLLIGMFGMAFNLFMQLGYQSSPNPGYVNAVNAASIVLVTLLSAWFFGDELNKKKLLGILGVVAGLLLLFL